MCRVRQTACVRSYVDGGPGSALGPSRPVEYRTARHPLSTAVSASRPPASVPPHADPFALRSDQGALLSLDFPLRQRRTRALFHPDESRITYPTLYAASLYPFLPCSPLLRLFLLSVTHCISLFVLPARISVRLLRPAFHSASFHVPGFPFSSPVSPFCPFFSSSSSSSFLSLLRRAVSHTRNARAPAIVLFLSPSRLDIPSLSGRPPFGVFNLPPSHNAPPPTPRHTLAAFCLRPEAERSIRSVPFARFRSRSTPVPLSRSRR